MLLTSSSELRFTPMTDEGLFLRETSSDFNFEDGFGYRGYQYPPLTIVNLDQELRVEEYSVESYAVTAWAGEVANLELQTNKDVTVSVELYDPANMLLGYVHYRDENGDAQPLQNMNLAGGELHDIELVVMQPTDTHPRQNLLVYDEETTNSAGREIFNEMFRVKIIMDDVNTDQHRERWLALRMRN